MPAGPLGPLDPGPPVAIDGDADAVAGRAAPAVTDPFAALAPAAAAAVAAVAAALTESG